MSTTELERMIITLEAATEVFRADMRKHDQTLAKSQRTVTRLTARMDRSWHKFEKSVSKRIKRMSTNIFSLRSAFGVVAGTAGIGLMIKRGLDLADSMDKSAAAAAISVERYQELKFASSQAGLAQAQLDVALQSLNRRFGLATDGNRTYASAFADLGVELRDAQGNIRSTDAVLEDSLRALAAIEDQALQTARASIIFGDDAGKKLPLLLRDGIEGLDSMRQKARELGLVLDQEAITKAVNARDKLSALGDSINTQLASAVANNAEAIEALAEAVGEALPDLIRLTREALIAFGLIEAGPRDLLRQLESGKLSQGELARDFGLFPAWTLIRELLTDADGARAAENQGQINALLEYLAAEAMSRPRRGGNNRDNRKDGTSPISDVQRSRYGGAVPVPGTNPLRDLTAPHPFQDRIDADRAAEENTRREEEERIRTERNAGMDQIMEKLNARTEQHNELLREGASLTEALLSPTERYQATLARLNEMLEAEAITPETYARALEQANIQLREATAATSGFYREFIEGNMEWMRDGRLSLDSLTDASLRAKDAIVNELINGALLSLIETVTNMDLDGRNGIGGVGGLFGSILGAFGLGSSAGAAPMSNAAGGASAPLALLAKGGVMTDKGPMPLNRYSKGGVARSPQLAMYGEGRQPEAYVPLPDGRNIPVKMDAPAPANNNAGTTVNIINNTGQPATQSRTRGADGREMIQLVIGEVASDIRQNGKVGQSISNTFGVNRAAR